MATTTATVSISSSDLMSGNPLSINATSTLMKTGLTTGMELMDMGRGSLTTAGNGTSEHVALRDASAVSADHDTANWLYLCNKATDDTFYIEVVLHDTVIGRLYAGDWMFTPWSMSDAAAEWSIEAEGGTCPYEYAFFKSAESLVASDQASLNP
tara:strand:- start:4034 stop:4495 length:462 start_codon:yes stop_codon:yes gene_type:complete